MRVTEKVFRSRQPFFIVILMSAILGGCSTLLTKSGKPYQSKSFGHERMWGCPYSGLKANMLSWHLWYEFSETESDQPVVKNMLAGVWGAGLLLDTPLTIVLDTAFLAPDFVHMIVIPERLEEICRK